MSATSHGDAASYVAAVRAELADLEPEVLEELTGGLEADLAELAAETDTPLAERVGPPAAYAAELRAAAGLAPGRSRLGALRAGPGHTWSRLRADAAAATTALRTHPSWGQMREFVVVLRPAWWVLRAWVAYMLVERFLTGYPHGAVPDRLEGWLVLIALVVLSVQLGREPGRSRWLARAVLAGNVAAVVALPFVADELTAGSYPDFTYASVDIPTGVSIDGMPVSNVYAYDAAGEPIYGVQLFAADGTPLTIGEANRGHGDRRGTRALLPAIGSDGQQLWNVYPLGVSGWTGNPGVQGAAPRIPDWAGAPQWFALPREAEDPVATPSPSPIPTTGAPLSPTTEPTASPSPALTPPP